MLGERMMGVDMLSRETERVGYFLLRSLKYLLVEEYLRW